MEASESYIHQEIFLTAYQNPAIKNFRTSGVPIKGGMAGSEHQETHALEGCQTEHH